MSAASSIDSTATIAPSGTAAIWLKHTVSLYIPASTLLFLWTGPHPWYVAPLFMLPLVLALELDRTARVELRQPADSLPALPFDVMVYALAGLQLLVVFELGRFFSAQGIFSIDMVMVFLVVGSSSGFSIITAHELIHRKKRGEVLLGRLLLCTVLYEHFYTEHLRGHHVRVGTPEDPATARYGERYEAFFRRTVPAQFRSAWSLEARRLGDADMGLFDRRMLRNRILHGFGVELGLATAIFLAFGPAALFAFVLQAFVAIRLLEAVNYFEHWGLIRSSRRVRAVDSWDTHSWFTYYGLTGLSRHADHHADPSRPYQQLRVMDEAPILPSGYLGMVDMVIEKNEEFVALASQELERRGLGPFAQGVEAPEVEASAQALEAPDSPAGERSLPATLKTVGTLAAFALGAALGIQWETGGSEMAFVPRLLLCAWVLAVFVVSISFRRRIQERGVPELASWTIAFAAIGAIGWLTDLLLA